MKRGEHQVTRLGRSKGDLDGLQVAHLPDQDDVGILPQGRAERLREPFGIAPHLTLIDHAPLVRVEELNRVFDGDDVVGPRFVDLVDDGRQRRGLARAGRPGDEYEPPGLVAKRVQDLRQRQIVDALDVDRDEPECGAQGALVEKGIDAETRLPVEGVREVYFPVGLQLLTLILVKDAVDKLAGLGGAEFGVSIEIPQVAVHPDHRRQAHGKVQVRRLYLDHFPEDLAYVHRSLSLVSPPRSPVTR
jgi:hypothetical protein